MNFSALIKAIPFALIASVALSAPSAPIKVGAAFSMTGGQATYGQESVNGMKLALEQINKKGIKGRQINLIVEDNKSEPMETANSVRKLIDIDKVVTVVGDVASSNTLAGAPIAQSKKVPMLTPASTNENVTKQGDFISRTCFTDGFQGKVMAKFAAENLKAKTAVVIVDNSSDYSKGLAENFVSNFVSAGGKVVGDAREFSYTQKDTDFKTLLQKVKRLKADVIFLPGYYNEVGLMLRQARQMGINTTFLGGDGWDSPNLQQLAGKAVENTYISSHFSPDDKDPKVQEFVRLYEKTYKTRPGAMAALGYDALLVLSNALERAKEINPISVKDALNATKDFPGVTGSITLDSNRNAVKSAVVLKVTEKGNTFFQKVSP